MFDHLRVGRAKLVTLRLLSLHVDYYSDNNETWNLIWSLRRLLRKSTGLVQVSLRDAMMSPLDFRFLLRSMANKAGPTLRRLDIVDSILPKPGRKTGVYYANLHTLLPKFTGLRHLLMNFTWLTPDLLSALSHSCQSLELLGLEVFIGRRYDYSTLTPADWQAAFVRLPTLRMEVTFNQSTDSTEDVKTAMTAMLRHLPAGATV